MKKQSHLKNMTRQHKRFPSQYCYTKYLTCCGLNEKGQGVVYFHDKPFYIDELLPNEEAIIVVYHENAVFGNGRAIKIKNDHPERILPVGHWKFKYGGYNIPHMSDQMQNNWKTQVVSHLFKRDISQILVGQRKHYRNKVVLHDGKFLPPGPYRNVKIDPFAFDLIDLDWSQYYQIKGNLIIRTLETTIAGHPGENKYCFDQLGNYRIRVNLNSFYQVNSEMALLAYRWIKKECPFNSKVLDMFSGIGTIGIFISDKVKSVTAVEINQQNHEDALFNIQNNQIQNITAIVADANTYFQNHNSSYDVVILDPTRRGVGKEILSIINKSQVQIVIYLSCNVFTQKPNIDLLTNFKITLIQPFDFFPQTYHIENLVVLKRK